MWKRLFIFILFAALLLGACTSRQAETPMEMPVAEGEANVYTQKSPAGGAPAFAHAPMPKMETVEENNSPERLVIKNASLEESNSPERLVIKNASLQLVVADPPAVMDDITKMAEQMQGYVVSANLYQSTTESGTKVPRASITIRVPADKLNAALEQIKAYSSDLPLQEDVTSQDVTGEYTDLSSRLRNLEAAEAQLQKIMEDAYTTNDVLQVYNQLVSVREQIEVTKGRMQYLEQSAALSAISVDLIADAAIQPVSIGGWHPTGVARDALRALIRTYQNIVDFLIWLVLYLIPVGAVIILPPYFVGRAIYRRIRRRKTPAA